MTPEWKSLLEAAALDLGCEAVAVFINRPAKGLAERVAFVGEEPRATVPFGVTPLGECAVTGVGVHRETRNTKAFKYHSHLYLPLLATDGKPFGVVSFSAVTADHFSVAERVTRAEGQAQSLSGTCLKFV